MVANNKSFLLNVDKMKTVPCLQNNFCPCAGRAFTFLLNEKSKQKNQEKMMLAYAMAIIWLAIFSGSHYLLAY